MLSHTSFTLIWIFVAVLTFFYLLFFQTAHYGRHTSTTWGPTISNRFAWFLMELPALALFLYFFISNTLYLNNVVLIFVLLWCLHYVNRTIIFPLRIKTTGKKMPMVIVLSAIFFNTINTYLIAVYLAQHPERYHLEWMSSWQFIVGTILFIVGYAINQYSDYLFINLRNPGETNYKIPHGFLFRWISCPNLFGELVEWLGFAIMTWCLPSWSFFVWTFANLVPRAIAHHKWYLKKFENYPKDRKAIFPFLW